jgi:hypothetical protein
MTDTRETVIALNRRRKSLRAELTGDFDQAKRDLHPRTLIQRFTHRKRRQLAKLADEGKDALKKNAPLIGFASAAILLFAARKPIFKAIDNLRNLALDAKDRSK